MIVPAVATGNTMKTTLGFSASGLVLAWYTFSTGNLDLKGNGNRKLILTNC
jgi:hypothetical protein